MLCHFFFDHFADKLRKKCPKYSLRDFRGRSLFWIRRYDTDMGLPGYEDTIRYDTIRYDTGFFRTRIFVSIPVPECLSKVDACKIRVCPGLVLVPCFSCCPEIFCRPASSGRCPSEFPECVLSAGLPVRDCQCGRSECFYRFECPVRLCSS
jgi:hypothetical protein